MTHKIKSILIILVIVVLSTSFVHVKAEYSSTNYKLEETTFGSGSTEDGTTGSYNLRGSLGQTGGGSGTSGNNNLVSGYITPSDEYLEMNVSSTSLDFGDLSTLAASTGNTTFNVRSYINSNYIVMLGNAVPVSQNGDTLNTLSVPSASVAGTEQFGINLVANTSPISFGADPVAVPDSSYANAVASSGYNSANLYKFVAGDTIAQSVIGNGQTNFTISYITNISSFTKSGTYSYTQELIVVPTY